MISSHRVCVCSSSAVRLRSEYSLKPQWRAGEGPADTRLKSAAVCFTNCRPFPQRIIGRFQLASVRRDDSTAEFNTKYYGGSFNDQNMLLRRHATVMLFAHHHHLLKKAIIQGCVCVCVGSFLNPVTVAVLLIIPHFEKATCDFFHH